MLGNQDKKHAQNAAECSRMHKEKGEGNDSNTATE